MRIQVAEEALKPNYYAFYLALKENKSVNKALVDMDISPYNELCKRKGKRYRVKLSDEALDEIIELKSQGYGWAELAEREGLSANTLYKRVKRYMGDEWKNRKWK